MHTVQKLLALATEYLKQKKISHAQRSAEELLAFVLKKRRVDLYLAFDQPLETREVDFFRVLLRRRGQREPLEYIIGEVSFLGCALNVSPGVLIPRQETEILLSKVCREIRGDEEKVLWDLCCGSGCLGLAMKKKYPKLNVTLSDISLKALFCAEQNAQKNDLHVSLLQGDLLTPFQGNKAHYILCNPPYVSEGEYRDLEPEVKHFEPKEALLGGKTGYEFYERLARELPHFLYPKGKVFLEIGAKQGMRILQIFNQDCWKKKYYEKDWAGHDRFFFLEMG